MSQKFTQLSTGTTPDGTEIMAVVQGGASKRLTLQQVISALVPTISNWDMSTDAFPSNSKSGQEYYGINGPTATLLDRTGSPISDGVLLKSLQANASTSDPTQWAITYTII